MPTIVEMLRRNSIEDAQATIIADDDEDGLLVVVWKGGEMVFQLDRPDMADLYGHLKGVLDS